MRKLAPTGAAVLGITAGLLAGQTFAQPAPRVAPPPAAAPPYPPPPGPSAVNPKDPYPYPPPPEDQANGQKGQAQARPKITGGLVAEAGGGVAGGWLAQGVGTAVAGPVGGFAAAWVGSSLGGKAVHAVQRVFHGKKPATPADQASAVDASATAPAPVANGPPSPD